MTNKIRCEWANPDSPLEVAYHDQEWGIPSYNDQHLFEMLILEGAQAGLSWSTILKKRDGYRKAFDHFDAQLMARYNQRKIESLKTNPGIVRNRLKIEAAVSNARLYLDILETEGSFSDYVWQFVDGIPKQNQWQSLEEIPATTKESEAMSKALKKRGFKFVGSTICYAYMQAVGMVNDHTTQCFRYEPIRSLAT